MAFHIHALLLSCITSIIKIQTKYGGGSRQQLIPDYDFFRFLSGIRKIILVIEEWTNLDFPRFFQR